MTEKKKKLSDRAREVMDALVDAVEALLSPPPAPVPARVRPPRVPLRRRR
ncbi:MAG TPA: hypothetical protein VLS88_11080 [Polyangiales bacterium]|nr:hypothetical protein [Polyangiales bacterium]